MSIFKTPTKEMIDLLVKSGSHNFHVATAAQLELAKALTLPLRKGVIKGDILSGIFTVVDFLPGQSPEFPMDILSPGTEKDHVAYTVPGIGAIPQKHVEGDYVMVKTYDVASSISWGLKYARDARWDIVSRCLEVLKGSFIRKFNTDGWHVLLAAGYGRNLSVYDDAATAGLFSKRLVALGKTVMRRNAGGNSTSLNQGKLTDLYLSPEGIEDIRSWDLTQIDEITRREIFIAGDKSVDGETSLVRIFNVNLHDIDEFGVGQEFQKYFVNTLGGTMASDKVEVSLGLDLANKDAFVMPVRKMPEMYEDVLLHRENKAGYYGRAEVGFASLDSRRVLPLMF